ncbi:guanine permease [Selenihalanaerobacter shriftii]|uniref:Putative MFS transporter, AGZA family, xanthine/uracil permease n=1 Tax=Selenihalanaerobacter shriftii TaxID=142842 RepID=A0A1T4NFS1_9FIRM|nr:guanine permease [Selenihalanaerobacter shriftii]SJZ78120.1 putative MFS transporter, AGZA family, xanthine/uracil permease [Selenihalanaerobacter shriftii]
MDIQDILAAIGVVINGLPQGLLALSFGFASVPTAMAFIIGAIGCGVLGLVAPISFQAETITLAGTMGNNLRERLSMIFFGATIMAFIGLFGMLENIINFIGPVITRGMMVGVGIMLSRVAINMSKDNKPVGFSSILAGVLMFVFTKDLVYTIVVSVVIGSIVSALFKQDNQIVTDTKEEFTLQKPILNPMVIRGALAMVCLNIGANIAFGNITGSIADMPVNIDHLAIVSSLADMGSSLFGGAPVESIISATGAAPHPIFSGVMMMSIMAIILFAGLLPKLGKYIPTEAIAGFLLVLGMIVTVPNNVQAAVDDPLVGGVTMTVTAITDPFLGMISGLIVKFLAISFGL